MKQPGLDGRHRDKIGTIGLKHGNTKNKNLPTPIPGFKPDDTLAKMRGKTGKTSEQAIRAAMRNRGK